MIQFEQAKLSKVKMLEQFAIEHILIEARIMTGESLPVRLQLSHPFSIFKLKLKPMCQREIWESSASFISLGVISTFCAIWAAVKLNKFSRISNTAVDTAVNCF